MFYDSELAKEASEQEADKAQSRNEQDDNYRFVSLKLGGRWRIASCKDGLQWIVQYRAGSDRWEPKKFYSRAAHILPWARQNLSTDAYLKVKQWAEKYPCT